MILLYGTIWVLLATFCAYYLRILFRFLKCRYILMKIPSPKGHWLVGNLLTVIKNPPEAMFEMLRNLAIDFWPIYRFNGFYVHTINLLHPCDIEIVLSQMKHLSKSRIYTLLSSWLKEGLLTSTGTKWQTRRKILTPAFHFNILQQFLKVFNEETDKLANQIQENCNEPYIDVVPYITQMTLQSISETAMGLGNIDEPTQKKYKDSVYEMGKILITKLTKPWHRVPFIYYFTKLKKKEEKIIDYLHGFAYQVIKSRENKLTELRNTKEYEVNVSYSGRKIVRMLDILLLAKMGGSDIDIEGIREEVDTFMFEGHDTTSMAITFLLLLLANHPDIQETVYQEIIEVLGLRAPTYDDLQELKYTERVIKETLRLYPSVPFISRVASEDFTTYTGYRIPRGTILHVHIFDLHRDPRIYPDPLKFDPDRFLPEICQSRHPFAYIPFSAGPRNCIGQRFAILELKAVLCGILRKFSLVQVDKVGDIGFQPDLVLRPNTGVKIKFIPK